MVILVDTDVLSFVFKNDSRFAKVRGLLARQESAISFMTLAETDRWSLSKSWSPQRKETFREFLEEFEVIWSNREMCTAWARIMDDCVKRGKAIHPSDAWIAATALILECPLLTNNTRHFATIDGLEVWNP